MKTLLIPILAGLAIVAGTAALTGCEQAKAQSRPTTESPSSPPLGYQANVFVSYSSTGDFTPGRNNPDASGKLTAISEGWVCIREGSYETWIPRDKIVMIKLSK